MNNACAPFVLFSLRCVWWPSAGYLLRPPVLSCPCARHSDSENGDCGRPPDSALLLMLGRCLVEFKSVLLLMLIGQKWLASQRFCIKRSRPHLIVPDTDEMMVPSASQAARRNLTHHVLWLRGAKTICSNSMFPCVSAENLHEAAFGQGEGAQKEAKAVAATRRQGGLRFLKRKHQPTDLQRSALWRPPQLGIGHANAWSGNDVSRSGVASFLSPPCAGVKWTQLVVVWCVWPRLEMLMFQVFVFVFFCLGPPTFSIANINLEIEPPFFLVATTWDYSQVICIYIFIFGIHLGTILYCMFFLVLYFFC